MLAEMGGADGKPRASGDDPFGSKAAPVTWT